MDWSIVLLEHPACTVSFLKLSEAEDVLLDDLINEVLGINTSLVLVYPLHLNDSVFIDHGPYHYRFLCASLRLIAKSLVRPLLLVALSYELNPYRI
jgi:hypothetical protein